MKLNPGDKITLEVSRVVSNSFSIDLYVKGTPTMICIDQSAIIKHEPAPRPLRAGDVVHFSDRVTRWAVVAIIDDKAWIRRTDASRSDLVVNVGYLTLIK